MALVRKRDIKKIITFTVIIGVFVIFGGYLVYSVLKPAGNTATPSDTGYIKRLPVISSFDENLFSQKDYQGLEGYGEEKLPLNFQNINKGKDNPFTR
ncbi:MAG: hypothetical protein ABIH38_03005 [Patescibacteria group bacterium]